MELLKFLMASVLAVLPIGVGGLILRLARQELKGDLMLGLAGLIGLGTVGTLFGILFLIPGAVATWTVILVAVVSGVCTALWFKGLPKNREPKSTDSASKTTMIFGLGLIILGLISLVGVITPSTSLDWDSIAYHLAVPKIWIQQGHAGPISYIHHSNFPGAVDAWFTVGELIGGQTASKTFTWWFTVYGAVAIFGFIKDRFSATSAWLCTIAFASIPMVMWESGTAYIDVANGLFAGFGFVFAAQYIEKRENSDLIIAAIWLSFAAGSKYTGLQAIFIASLVVLLLINKADKLGAVRMGGLAAVFSGFWYSKNWNLVGNPVYPFFFSVFGGKNWDKFNGDIYADEQRTFGYHGVANLGQSLFGLVTSPGRFTNPQPTIGNGFAFVSLGFAVVAGAVIGIIKGLTSKFDKSLALMTLLQLVAWFALSQQSRYILTLVVPMLYFVAIALQWKPMSKLVMGAIGLQVIASIWVSTNSSSMFAERLPVLIGALTRDEFLGGFKREDGSQAQGHVDTYALSKVINADPNITKVALFDEVFGYYLDKPYFWAGPGHTTELDYATITTADAFVANLKKLNISHAYVTNKYLKLDPEAEKRFDQAMGLQSDGTIGVATPYPADIRAKAMLDERDKWRVLFAEAVAAKKITLVTAFSKTRFLFKIE